MLPSTQMLTGSTSHANYKSDDSAISDKPLISSSFVFLHVDQKNISSTEEMQAGSRGRGNNDDLWHSMGSRRQGERREEQSAYHFTSSHHSPLRGTFAPVPMISTSTVDRPTPSSPESHRRRNKPASLRSLLSRRSSAEPGTADQLPLASPHSHHRSSSRDGKLIPEPLFSARSSSRSMPNSPLAVSTNHPDIARAKSASPAYPVQTQYEPPSLALPVTSFPQRATSMETYFDPNASRNTWPHSDPRPSTAMPQTYGAQPETEPFNDYNEFHLFAEAMSGLPDSFDAMSPNEAPRLQASLFARGNQNDMIPLPLMNSSAFESRRPSSNDFASLRHSRDRSTSRSEYRGYSQMSRPAHTSQEVIPIPSMDDEWDPQQRRREITGYSSVPNANDRWSSHQHSDSALSYSTAVPGIDSYEQPSSFDAASSSNYAFPPPSNSDFPRRASYDRPPTEPMPPHLAVVNMELERLGIEDEQNPDDELPNYQQSQAEMNERRRVEASARARELENRWNSSRGYR
ncbi:unnamed protein product [Periconia digitata]|uniref:Uncharacterized protein n=1 Tax=Periconia digitata TaxID=1303443 RepID=A0A9W4U860_9PLEO|nr:unnamed protein product [Periconia digitata]